jgi:hypothetical protein
MSRLLKMCSVVVLAVGVAAAVAAEGPSPEVEWKHRIHPAGLIGVPGQIFEEVRGPIEDTEELVPFLKHGLKVDDRTIEGKSFTAVKYVYRDQPADFQNYLTTNTLDPTLYMAAQFAPKSSSTFIRVDFNVHVSVEPAADKFAGCGYTIYVKEDGGDGRIENPGEIECGGDDTCGYLKQFVIDGWVSALWLGATTNADQYTMASTSNFFRIRCRRKYEIQAHVYPVHFQAQGSVVLNGGFLGLTSGK